MINNPDFITKPYNDDFMTYNYKENRYVLTVDGANASNFDILQIMGSRDTVNQYLDLLSRTLYSVFLKNNDSKLHDRKLFMLSHSKHFRETIQKIFMDILWYNYRSGGFMTIYQSGINMNEMKAFELSIEQAMGVIGNNMAKITGINERTLRFRISRKNVFKTLGELKVALVEKGLYTTEELEKVVSYKEIPQTYDYLIYKDLRSGLILEDFTYWKEQLQLKGTEW